MIAVLSVALVWLSHVHVPGTVLGEFLKDELTVYCVLCTLRLFNSVTHFLSFVSIFIKVKFT